MAGAPQDSSVQKRLMMVILEKGKQAFDPNQPLYERQQNLIEFQDFLDSTQNVPLINALNILLGPTQSLPWLRDALMHALACLPLRPNGVQNTIEVVIAVHPSTNPQGAPQQPGQKSSIITHEALNAASRLLSTPPYGMSPQEWFDGLAPQLFALLDGHGDCDMDRVAAYIIGFGILGRKQYGAPGAPGWQAFVSPILRCLDPTHVSNGAFNSAEVDAEKVVFLGSRQVLVNADELFEALRRLTTLLISHPYPSLAKRVLSPVIMPLWALTSWPHPEGKDYRTLARRLLIILLKLSPRGPAPGAEAAGNALLTAMMADLAFTGTSVLSISWTYAPSKDGRIQLEKRNEMVNQLQSRSDLQVVNIRVNEFVDLLKESPDLADQISPLFLQLCHEALSSMREASSAAAVTIFEQSTINAAETKLIRLGVLQAMLRDIPEKLLSNSKQLLELVNDVLSGFGSADGDDEVVSLSLSLLNMVLTSSNFQRILEVAHLLEKIQKSLSALGKSNNSEVSTTAHNLLFLLNFRMSEEEPVESGAIVTDPRIEDRRTHELALSYLTTADSPPPVRVQGLDLLTGLIEGRSPILDIPSLLVLVSSLLQDSEEYIYLRTIKSIVQLAKYHPKAVIREQLDRFVDSDETSILDARLRHGEALLQVIENMLSSFTGDVAKRVCEGLIFIAGRRAYRPKSKEEQERKAKATSKQEEQAFDPDILNPDISHEDHELLTRIVRGWESKRGVEDVRIRASALTILGSAVEAKISSIDPELLSAALDLSIHVLTIETEHEKGILRRAAILLVLSFVRSLDVARLEGRNLGFGLASQSSDNVQRILTYVEGTDNDHLVRQHARDVMASLEASQMRAILPTETHSMDIQGLAGLSLKPGDSTRHTSERPKIEEVE